jgi:hypothetical protein
MIDYSEITLKLYHEGYFKNQPKLILLDKLEINSAKKMGLRTDLEINQVYFGMGGAYEDILINTHFDLIFPSSSILTPENVNVTLIGIEVRRNFTAKILPSGYSGLGLFEFNDKMPKCLDLLRDRTLYDSLVLTTQDCYNKILERLGI